VIQTGLTGKKRRGRLVSQVVPPYGKSEVKMDILKIFRPPGPQARRNQRVFQEGSPPYTWTIGVLAAAATIAIYLDTQFPASRKYAPLDKVEIVNSDVVDLTVTINGVEPYDVPAGAIRTVADGVGIRHCQVTNDDAAVATTAGAVVLRFQKKPADADSILRRVFGGAIA